MHSILKLPYLLKPLIRRNHFGARVGGHVVADEADAVADRVLALRVSPYSPPPPALVDLAVAANDKTVAYITPFLRQQFKDELHASNHSNAIFTLLSIWLFWKDLIKALQTDCEVHPLVAE